VVLEDVDEAVLFVPRWKDDRKLTDASQGDMGNLSPNARAFNVALELVLLQGVVKKGTVDTMWADTSHALHQERTGV